jgi:phage N-6-adenine-methyltransferase
MNDARLDTIAREVEAKLKKADKSQTYTDDMVTSVDLLIEEASIRCKKLGLSFNAWLKKCPSIGKSRAYERRAIALGIKTPAQVRAATLKRLGRHVVKVSVNGKTVKLSDGATQKPQATKGTGDNEWNTPVEYLEMARQVLGGFDTCPASNAFAKKRFDFGSKCQHYTKEDNALIKQWRGRVWLNPPYSRDLIGPFVDKLLSELEAGRVTAAIMLVNPAVDTAWFKKAERVATAICFTPKQRIKFKKAEGSSVSSPVWGNAFFFFGADVAKFKEVFGPLRRVWL